MAFSKSDRIFFAYFGNQRFLLQCHFIVFCAIFAKLPISNIAVFVLVGLEIGFQFI